MKQSQLFTHTLKELPKDETSYNAQVLLRAGFIDKVAAGVYSFLPLGWRVMEKIRQIIREEMQSIGGQEINLPTLAPKENWQKTGRWESLDILFKIAASDKKEYALNPTHEEVVTPLAGKFINSYRELPFAVFQIQTKFRNEKRAKAGLLRGREFTMKDLYSFHADQVDLDRYYEQVIQAYVRIFNRVGLGDNTYLTFAAGGSFSKYSHEFQTLTAAGEDLIYICDKCHLAVNQEIIAEQSVCPQCGDKDWRKEKAVEVGNIFKLGTRYSDAFALSYSDKNSVKQPVVMGCYGLGLSRIMGTVVEVCHDERGIIWPQSIAPFRVHLLSLKANEEAEKIYQKLGQDGIEVLYDDRDVSAGEKFAEADLIGCPYRLVISQKTLIQNGVEIKRRVSQETEIIKFNHITAYVQ